MSPMEPSALEKLLLAQAVHQQGSAHWIIIAAILNGHPMTGSDSGWTEVNTKETYAALLEEHHHPSYESIAKEGEDPLLFPPKSRDTLYIAQVMFGLRMVDLKAQIQQKEDQFKVMASELETLRAIDKAATAARAAASRSNSAAPTPPAKGTPTISTSAAAAAAPALVASSRATPADASASRSASVSSAAGPSREIPSASSSRRASGALEAALAASSASASSSAPPPASSSAVDLDVPIAVVVKEETITSSVIPLANSQSAPSSSASPAIIPVAITPAAIALPPPRTGSRRSARMIPETPQPSPSLLGSPLVSEASASPALEAGPSRRTSRQSAGSASSSASMAPSGTAIVKPKRHNQYTPVSELKKPPLPRKANYVSRRSMSTDPAASPPPSTVGSPSANSDRHPTPPAVMRPTPPPGNKPKRHNQYTPIEELKKPPLPRKTTYTPRGSRSGSRSSASAEPSVGEGDVASRAASPAAPSPLSVASIPAPSPPTDSTRSTPDGTLTRPKRAAAAASITPSRPAPSRSVLREPPAPPPATQSQDFTSLSTSSIPTAPPSELVDAAASGETSSLKHELSPQPPELETEAKRARRLPPPPPPAPAMEVDMAPPPPAPEAAPQIPKELQTTFVEPAAPLGPRRGVSAAVAAATAQKSGKKEMPPVD